MLPFPEFGRLLGSYGPTGVKSKNLWLYSHFYLLLAVFAVKCGCLHACYFLGSYSLKKRLKRLNLWEKIMH